MSAQPIEAAPIVPLPEELEQPESHLHVVPDLVDQHEQLELPYDETPEEPVEKPNFRIVNNDENTPAYAKLEKPESLSFKEWQDMNILERKAAVEATKPVVHDVDGLVSVDAGGRARHAKGNGKLGGRFLTDHEAGLIAEHEDQINEGLKDRGTPDSESAPVLERPDSIPQEEWDKWSDEDKAMMVEIIAGRIEKIDNAAPALRSETILPVKGLRNRARLLMAKAYNKLSELRDPENGSRRKKVIAGVVGAVVVAGISYAAYKHGTGAGPEPHHAHKGHGGAGHLPVHGGGAHQAVHLEKGGTVWGIAEDRLGPNASDHQVYLETKRLLALNHISWEQARHLPVGEGIKV